MQFIHYRVLIKLMCLMIQLKTRVLTEAAISSETEWCRMTSPLVLELMISSSTGCRNNNTIYINDTMDNLQIVCIHFLTCLVFNNLCLNYNYFNTFVSCITMSVSYCIHNCTKAVKMCGYANWHRKIRWQLRNVKKK